MTWQGLVKNYQHLQILVRSALLLTFCRKTLIPESTHSEFSDWTHESPTIALNTSTYPSDDIRMAETVVFKSCHYIQVLSPGSFVTKNTAVTSTLQTAEDNAIGLGPEVIITAHPNQESMRAQSTGTQYVICG